MSALRDWSPGFLYEIQPPPFPMRKLRVYFPTAQEIQWKSRSRIDSEVSTVVPAMNFLVLCCILCSLRLPLLSSLSPHHLGFLSHSSSAFLDSPSLISPAFSYIYIVLTNS